MNLPSELLSTAIGWYREPLFWLFPVATSVVSIVMFLVFAGPLTWLADSDPVWARKYRIQSRHDRHVGTDAALRQWLINNAQSLILVVLIWPLLRLSAVHAGPLPKWWMIAGQLLFFIYLDDFLYYWFHRAMHTRWLLRHIHGVHHRIYAPRAIAGHYMHPVEYGLTSFIALIGPLLLGAHVFTIWLWVAFRQWEAAEGHCGYDFHWSPTRWLPFSDGALHHDFHHAKVKGNFAGFLRWTDQVFGTLAPGYEAHKGTGPVN
jgi:plant 4alpha-monomethylsterol monooxygenase